MLNISDLEIGSNKFCLIAGPCSIESREQLETTAKYVKENGASVLRGGIYKMRTKPDSFQGLGADAYQLVKEVKKEQNLPFVTEITDPRQISDLAELADIFQVGSRNMYNYALLKELGNYDKPVLLKRGFSATVEEWTKAAEYVEAAGNAKVILCERGIRGFDNVTRNILDLASVSYIKKHTHYPVVVDPSHATGRADLIKPMALASVAAGADGLIIETHPEPEKALSDGFQSLNPAEFADLAGDLKRLLEFYDKSLS